MTTEDRRNHIESLLMRESLLDKSVMASTASPRTFRMLPDVSVIKIGGRTVIEAGKDVCYGACDALMEILDEEKLIISTGGGARTRHVFSVGIDLGLPAGVLAQLSMVDALGNAHVLGTILAPKGVVAIPPEIFGHLLPLFVNSVPGVIFNGVPPYNLWEHPPRIGRIPPNRSDAGAYQLGECFGVKSVTLAKDVDGLYDKDPNRHSDARLIDRISVQELKQRKLKTLPFDRILLDLMENARLIKQIQLINAHHPERIKAAIRGEHVGTIIYLEE